MIAESEEGSKEKRKEGRKEGMTNESTKKGRLYYHCSLRTVCFYCLLFSMNRSYFFYMPND